MARKNRDDDAFLSFASRRIGETDNNISARQLIREARAAGVKSGSNANMNALVRELRGAEKLARNVEAGRKGGSSSGITRGLKSPNEKVRQRAEEKQRQRSVIRDGGGAPSPTKKVSPDPDEISYGIALEDLARGEEGRFLPAA